MTIDELDFRHHLAMSVRKTQELAENATPELKIAIDCLINVLETVLTSYFKVVELASQMKDENDKEKS